MSKENVIIEEILALMSKRLKNKVKYKRPNKEIDIKIKEGKEACIEMNCD